MLNRFVAVGLVLGSAVAISHYLNNEAVAIDIMILGALVMLLILNPKTRQQLLGR